MLLKQLLFLVLLFLLVSPNLFTVSAAEENSINTVDSRVLVLEHYLQNYDSPLANHAGEIINAADKHHIDWKLIPAIAGVESNFGRRIPGGIFASNKSHNAWGWGVYGDNSLSFRSWEEAIEKVTKGVKEGFINQGLDTPYKMNPKYASSTDWGWQVDFFLTDIESYTNYFLVKHAETINIHNFVVTRPKLPTQKFEANNIFFSSARLIADDYQLSLDIREF